LITCCEQFLFIATFVKLLEKMMALGVQVFLHLSNNAVQPLNLILNTAQESFCHFNCLQWLAHSCPASSMLIMCMQLEVRKMIISSEVCAMFLTQHDDLAQQSIVADFLLL
jgi:hypothetical protein